MRAFRLLMGKDLRLLARSPVLLAVLVGYPLLVAVLVATAVQGDRSRPVIAVVNLDTPGRSVQVGDRRLTVDDYLARMSRDARVEPMTAPAAAAALDGGRVTGVLTIPAGFIGDLQSGVRQPTLRLVTSRRSPVEGTAVQRRMEAAVYRFNQGLAQGYVDQVLRLVDYISNGGNVGIFGREGDLIGLRRSREIVVSARARLLAADQPRVAAQLAPLLGFIDLTQRNLDLAKPAATAIASPIRLDVATGAAGREPLSAFGTAGALLVSVALISVLLAAAGIAAEREEFTLPRLRRGLVPVPWLVAQKVALGALACLLVGMVALVAVAGLTDLAVGRWAWWPPTLLLAGVAFAGFGVLVGAAARETRTALLAALMVTLPLTVAAFIPGRVPDALGTVLPFGRGFEVFRMLLADPAPGAMWGNLTALALMGAVLAALATFVLHRRPVA